MFLGLLKVTSLAALDTGNLASSLIGAGGGRGGGGWGRGWCWMMSRSRMSLYVPARNVDPSAGVKGKPPFSRYSPKWFFRLATWGVWWMLTSASLEARYSLKLN